MDIIISIIARTLELARYVVALTDTRAKDESGGRGAPVWHDESGNRFGAVQCVADRRSVTHADRRSISSLPTAEQMEPTDIQTDRQTDGQIPR